MTKHTAYIQSSKDYLTVIDGRPIYSEIFDQEMVDYRLVETENQIDDLIQWIAESNKDKWLMKEDLEYLMKLEDEYVFSSILTNEFIASSDNPERFDEICEEILLEDKIMEGIKVI